MITMLYPTQQNKEASMSCIINNRSYNDKAALVMNMFWSVVAVIINYAIAFLVTPYVTNTSGAEAYGFVVLANNFTAYIDVIVIAFNAFAVRFISVAYHQGNFNQANKYYNSAIIADIMLSGGILATCTILIVRLEKLLNISDYLIADIKILFFLVLARYLISVISATFTVGTFISNSINKTERQKSISNIVRGVMLFGLFALFPTHVWFVGLAGLMAALWLFFVNCTLTKKLTPKLKINIHDFEFRSVFVLLSAGVWNSINNLGNILNNGLDLIVTNLMLSSIVMGDVSIGKSLGTIFHALLESCINAFCPKLLQLYAEGKKEALVRELKTVMRFSGIISNVVFAVFVSCGLAFMKLWVPAQNTELIYKIAVIVLLSDATIGVVRPLYYVFTLTNCLKVPSCITILMGIVNVVSMYFLIKYTKLGVYAVVLTTLFLNYTHFLDTPLYSAHCLKIKLTTFYGIILRHLASCIITAAIVLCASAFMPTADTWFNFLLKSFVCLLLGLLLAIFTGCSRDDIKSLIKKVSYKARG